LSGNSDVRRQSSDLQVGTTVRLGGTIETKVDANFRSLTVIHDPTLQNVGFGHDVFERVNEGLCIYGVISASRQLHQATVDPYKMLEPLLKICEIFTNNAKKLGERM